MLTSFAMNIYVKNVKRKINNMTSSTTSTTFTCLTCEQPVVPSLKHTCIPKMPQTVMEAIYNCKVCNPTDYTFYKCNCDKRVPKRQIVVIPPLSLPITPITEIEENTDDFTSVFKFDDDNEITEAPVRRRNALSSSVDINPDDLPGDLVSRCQAIDKIFRDAEKK